MPQSKLSPALFLALHNKLLADINLLRLQQDVNTGKRAFSASAMLSALEDCDDALTAVWLEVRQAMHNEIDTEAPGDKAQSQNTQDISTMASALIAATQQSVRQLFTRAPKPNRPLHPGGA